MLRQYGVIEITTGGDHAPVVKLETLDQSKAEDRKKQLEKANQCENKFYVVRRLS